MDIVVWLRSLGLGKYEAIFRENEITEKVLPNLTAEDLKELGVAALEHRRTLLDAIAALRIASRSNHNSASLASRGSTARWTEYTGELVKNYTGKLVKIRPIMDIGGWLRGLGLDEYETAFRENKVDAAVLPKLTAEDLKDLRT